MCAAADRLTIERVQGFATGLLYRPEQRIRRRTRRLPDQKATLLHRSDWIRVGLDRRPARLQLYGRDKGNVITGGQLDYQGQPTGYTELRRWRR